MMFKERKQQIHMGELLGPICAVLRWPNLLKDRSAVFFVDNMGVLCNIINGTSSQLDAGSLTFALHLRIATLQITPWWEWVESDSNCSDGGSRIGITCPLARELGIHMSQMPFPRLPDDFLSSNPSDWVEFWEEQSFT